MIRTATIALALACAPSAHAGMSGPCVPADTMRGIVTEHGQSVVAFGSSPTQDGGEFIVFLALGSDGSWSLLFTGSDGRLCVAAAGAGWTGVEPPAAPVPGQDS